MQVHVWGKQHKMHAHLWMQVHVWMHVHVWMQVLSGQQGGQFTWLHIKWTQFTSSPQKPSQIQTRNTHMHESCNDIFWPQGIHSMISSDFCWNQSFRQNYAGFSLAFGIWQNFAGRPVNLTEFRKFRWRKNKDRKTEKRIAKRIDLFVVDKSSFYL